MTRSRTNKQNGVQDTTTYKEEEEFFPWIRKVSFNHTARESALKKHVRHDMIPLFRRGNQSLQPLRSSKNAIVFFSNNGKNEMPWLIRKPSGITGTLLIHAFTLLMDQRIPYYRYRRWSLCGIEHSRWKNGHSLCWRTYVVVV